jgi:translation initiation factor eIF-2B subunit delta
VLLHQGNERMIPRTVATLVGELAEDHTSGAAEIAIRASQVLVTFVDQSKAEDADSFLGQLLAAGRALIQAQPSMAPLFNLVNSTVGSVEGVREVETARDLVRTTAKSFGAQLGLSSERIAQEALSLFPSGCRVLTHSRSSTVLEALHLAAARGHRLEVVNTESRPILEGHAVASTLAQQGIKTTLITDSAAGQFVGSVDLVVVGADSISPDGLVNKLGTFGVALAAKAHGVPFYTLCGTEKFLPTGYPYLRIEPQDPQEVWPDPPQGVEVVNLYFDVTPLEYLTGVVTEQGILSVSELVKALGQINIHDILLDEEPI